MANFKEKLKKLFNNKLVKAISIIFMCIIGFVLLGRCNKVEAAPINLPDGTVSKVDLSTSQVFKDKAMMSAGRLSFVGSYNVVVTPLTGGVYVYYSCSLSDNILTCSAYKNITSTGSVSSNSNAFKFEIGYNYVKRILGGK